MKDGHLLEFSPAK